MLGERSNKTAGFSARRWLCEFSGTRPRRGRSVVSRRAQVLRWACSLGAGAPCCLWRQTTGGQHLTRLYVDLISRSDSASCPITHFHGGLIVPQLSANVNRKLFLLAEDLITLGQIAQQFDDDLLIEVCFKEEAPMGWLWVPAGPTAQAMILKFFLHGDARCKAPAASNGITLPQVFQGHRVCVAHPNIPSCYSCSETFPL